MSGTLDPATLEHWRSWIGRTEVRREIVCAESVRRFAASVDADVEVEQLFPQLGHWALFVAVDPAVRLGRDGHPVRGDFLPPITFPRRMFAASDIHFLQPMQVGVTA